MLNINDFPEIILLKIFGFLKYGELCRSKGVCKKWYSLMQSQVLVRMVDASDVVLDYHQMVQLVPHLGIGVTCLHIQGTLQKMLLTPMLLRQLQERCPHLDTLVLEGAFVSKDSGVSNVTLHDFPAQIQTLSLRKSFFHLEQLVLNRIDRPRIRSLDLSHCWCINDLHYIYLTQLPHLQELYLNGCDSLKNFQLLVSRLPQLKVLDIESNHCTENLVEVVGAACPGLQKLYLGWMKILDSHAPQFVGLSNLKELCLCGTGLTDIGFECIVRQTRLPLRWLNCSQTFVSESAVQNAKLARQTCTFVSSGSQKRRQEREQCNHFLRSIYAGGSVCT